MTAEHPAFDLTRRMHDAARRGDWAAVASLHAEREPTLASPFASGEMEALRRIRELDAETVRWAEDAREDVARQIAALQRGREAADLYNEAGSG
jgi:hypothetical protein